VLIYTTTATTATTTFLTIMATKRQNGRQTYPDAWEDFCLAVAELTTEQLLMRAQAMRKDRP